MSSRLPGGGYDVTTNYGAGNDDDGAIRMTFARRPTAVPADVRPEWRIPLILLLVDRCRGHVASREQLHVLSSAVLNEASRRALLAAIDGRLAPRSPAVQFEPALDRALDRALGLGLLRLTGPGRLALTDTGKAVVVTLANEQQLFTAERTFLAALPKSLSQAAIRKVLTARSSL